MDKAVKRYHQLKEKQKQLEDEMTELRREILKYCEEQQADDMRLGGCRVRIVRQERRDYDTNKLFEALPDPKLWGMVSKPDSTKIASLVKLNVIGEERLKDTYSLKHITLLHVDKV